MSAGVSERALPPDADAPETVEWAGDFVLAKRRGRWEYASRARGIRAAVILAVDAGEVVLVEQYRVPTHRLYTMSFSPSELWTVAFTGQTYSHGAFSQCMHGTGCENVAPGRAASPAW